MQANFIKNINVIDKLIFIDGLWGSGKSIMGPVIGSFKNVERQRIEHIYGYLSTLYKFDKIKKDAAITMMKLYADLAIYNSMISREVNFRIFDESGLINNPGALKTVLRLFNEDGDIVVDRIKKDGVILQIMTHIMLWAIELAFESFGDQLRLIEMVRNPLFMIDHWYNYIERCGTDPREFTLWIEYKGQALPYFATGWEEEYIHFKTLDKVIHSINWVTKQTDKTYQTLTDGQKKQIMFIPFENFVLSPWEYMDQLEIFLGTNYTKSSKKALKRQKCPRKQISAGLGHKNYGWKKPDKNLTNSDDYKQKKLFVEKNASNESQKILYSLCEQYEKKYKVVIM